jgi:hypothetical protein
MGCVYRQTKKSKASESAVELRVEVERGGEEEGEKTIQ